MSDRIEFTFEDGARLNEIFDRGSSLGRSWGERFAYMLNDAFPDGKAAPKPAMRTTPVTADECHGENVTQVCGKFFPDLPASKVAEIHKAWMKPCAKAHEAINEVLGLREEKTEPKYILSDDEALAFGEAINAAQDSMPLHSAVQHAFYVTLKDKLTRVAAPASNPAHEAEADFFDKMEANAT